MKRVLVLLLAVLVPAAAIAQSTLLAQAIADGQVGERFDGYMGFAVAPPPALRRQVLAINIQRRNLYTELGSRRQVSPDLVGRATACQLFTRLAPGEPYLLNDGVWRRVAPGQPAPVPADCR